ALARCEGVGQAVVVAWEDGPGDKRLVAYIVPQRKQAAGAASAERGESSTVWAPPGGARARDGDEDSSGLRASALRAALRLTLPEYMVPSAFVFLEALPLTPNLKVDRKALPGPEHVRSDLDAAFEPPQGATEERLAGILSSLLKVPRVGRKDNFFD